MYYIIRESLGLVLIAVSIILINRSKATRKLLLRIVVCVAGSVFTFILAFIPVENLFITFSSPVKAYEYWNFGKTNIVLTVEGTESTFVVDRHDNTNTVLIIPKTADGWKVGIGTYVRIVSQTITDRVYVDVNQYKNTNDYYLFIFDSTGGEAVIKDAYNTEFQSFKQVDNKLNKTFFYYYACVPEYTPEYSVTVNGITIPDPEKTNQLR